jgi:hypothetical protein
LQFVTYGYQRRGIVFGRERFFAELSAPYRVHLMLHELWLGWYREASLKDRLVGAVQRTALLGLIRRLGPQQIHTSNPAYRRLLRNCGLEAHTLPLFGAVPIAPPPAHSWLDGELARHGLAADGRTAHWLFGFFGSLWPKWPPEPLFGALQAGAARHGRKAAILSVGRLGPGEALWNSFEPTYGERLRFVRLGPQPPERISEYLQRLDCGIAVTPYQLIGKSSAVAAMLEHGLPVIVNRDDTHLPGWDDPEPCPEPLVHRFDGHLVERLPEVLRRETPRLRLPGIARQFLDDLERNRAAGPLCA